MRRIDPRSVLPLRIETERLTLRAPMRSDVPQLAELANNKKIFEVLARLPHPYSRSHAIAFVEIFAQRQDERVYAIVPKGNGKEQGLYSGSIGFHFAPGQLPELGYWLGEPFWGRGWMSEAAKALVEAAQATGQFPQMRASALASNAGSLKVLEKSGFVPTGSHISTTAHTTGQTVIDLVRETRPT